MYFLHFTICLYVMFLMVLCGLLSVNSLDVSHTNDAFSWLIDVIFAFLSCTFHSYMLAGWRSPSDWFTPPRVVIARMYLIYLYFLNWNNFYRLFCLYDCVFLYWFSLCIAMSSHIMLWLHLCPDCCRSVKGGRPKYPNYSTNVNESTYPPPWIMSEEEPRTEVDGKRITAVLVSFEKYWSLMMFYLTKIAFWCSETTVMTSIISLIKWQPVDTFQISYSFDFLFRLLWFINLYKKNTTFFCWYTMITLWLLITAFFL